MSHTCILQHTATLCNTLQHTATHRSASSTGHWGLTSRTPSPRATTSFARHKSKCSSKNSMRYVHCSTLHHTATHYTTHCKTLQTHCKTLPLTTTHSFPESDYFICQTQVTIFFKEFDELYTAQHTATHGSTLQHTLQHTLQYTLQHTPFPRAITAFVRRKSRRGFDKRCGVLQRVAVCRSVL